MTIDKPLPTPVDTPPIGFFGRLFHWHEYDQWKIVDRSAGNLKVDGAVVGYYRTIFQERKCRTCGYVQGNVQEVRSE